MGPLKNMKIFVFIIIMLALSINKHNSIFEIYLLAYFYAGDSSRSGLDLELPL